jgi:F-type H+-transporting ATPase subunit a
MAEHANAAHTAPAGHEAAPAAHEAPAGGHGEAAGGHTAAPALPEFLWIHDPKNPHDPMVPVYYGWIALAVLVGLAVWGRLSLSKTQRVPGFIQNLWEFVVEWVSNVQDQAMGPGKGREYFPLFISFFLFILVNNFMGLIPGMMSPTSKINTTLALALVAFFSIHIFGMVKKGPLAYWGHFFHVVDASKAEGIMKLIMLPLQFILLPAIELIGELARPLSLAMRLFGNILAKEILLAVLFYVTLIFYFMPGPIGKVLMFVPLLMGPAILVLGVLVSIIQAVVFTVLCMVYISGATAVHEEHGHGGHEESHAH